MNIFKEMYETEIARRQEINGEVALPAGVLTVLGGVLATMLREYSWSGGAFQWVFGGSVALAALALLTAVVYLIRSYWGPGLDTQYVAKPDDLFQHVEELRDYYRQYGDTEQSLEEAVASNLQASLEGQFADAGAYNAQQNDRRSELLYRAKGFMIICLLLTGAAALPYAFDMLLPGC